jgi:16S rRNA G1207 methylase RsmC
VVLSGRLALTREIDSIGAAEAVSAFIAEHYDRYRMRPIARVELEAMTIVARWLRERQANDGRLIYLNGATLDPRAIISATNRTGVDSASSVLSATLDPGAIIDAADSCESVALDTAAAAD